MANHDILLSSALNAADMEQGPMDEESFDKMSKDLKRPRTTGVSVFRGPAQDHGKSVTVDHRSDQDRVREAITIALPNPDKVWESLTPVTLDEARLTRNGVFPNQSSSPATAAFDILRTQILQAMQDRGWRRIAVTSPTHGCGKTFVAANLAFSLARRPSSRTMLVDLELRAPGMAKLLGLRDVHALRDYLTGEQPLESQFHRVGQTLALGLNSAPVPQAAELLQEPGTIEALDDMMVQLDPQIAIFDAPPALVSDDVLSLLPQVDAVLLVADGTQTTAADIRACERLFNGRAPIMGVVLNRAQDRDLARYRYNRA